MRLIFLLIMLVFVSPAVAQTGATFMVDSEADAPDTNTSDNLCIANVAGAAHCTLRAAIQQANTSTGADNIHFNLPGTNEHILTFTSALPALTDTIILDGYTQVGSLPANSTAPARLTVILDFTEYAGLVLDANSSVIRGLQITNAINGVTIDGTGNVAEGNWIVNNLQAGVLVSGDGALIGGTTTATHNIISGNGGSGVLLTSSAVENVVQGNFIGTDAMGTAAVANGEHGIDVDGAEQTSVANNLISGNAGSGVVVSNAPMTGLLHNVIGLDSSTWVAIPNQAHGLVLENLVGGNIGVNVPGMGNTIAGNLGDGIYMVGTSGVSIRGNWIGTTNAFTYNLGNSGHGIHFATSTANWIGGEPYGNIIAYNGQAGIYGDSGGQNSFEGNTIHANGEQGIRLDILANPDAGEVIVSSIVVEDDHILIDGWVEDAPASTTAYVEFFANAACDLTQKGEGQKFLGGMNIPTNTHGMADFTDVAFAFDVDYYIITATVATQERGTSAFSACVNVPIPPDNRVPNLNLYHTNRPTLSWGGVTWAVSYEVEIDNNADFSSPLPLLISTNMQVLTSPLSDDVYYWRVRGVGEGNLPGEWSTADSFVVDAIP